MGALKIQTIFFITPMIPLDGRKKDHNPQISKWPLKCVAKQSQ